MSFRWYYPDTDNNLEPEFLDRLKGLQKKVGGPQDLHVFDGYRSVARQDEIRANAEQNGLNPDEYFAPPGQSAHNFGLAADVLGNLQDAHRNASSYGLFFPEKNDPWHVEPVYVTQRGIPEPDEAMQAQMAVTSALREGKMDDNTLTQWLRASALDEAEAERYNTDDYGIIAPTSSGSGQIVAPGQNQQGVPLSGEKAGESGQSAATGAISGQQRDAIARLEEQKSLNEAMTAMAAPPAASAPGGVGAPGRPAPAGTGWQNIDAFLQANGVPIGPPSKGQTDGGSHASGSYHYQGTARDYGTAGSDPAAIYALMLPMAQNPDGPIAELFWDPSGAGWKNGKNIGPIGGHSDHVHVALKPGRSLAEVGGGTAPAAGPARMTIEEAAVKPEFQLAWAADVLKRGAEKSYAKAVPMKPVSETQPGQVDRVEEAQTGRAEGETEVLEPGVHETPAGIAEIAKAATEGTPIQTQEEPPASDAGPPPDGSDPEAMDRWLRTVAWNNAANKGKGGNYGNDIDGWIHQAMQLTGVPESEFQWIKKKALQESGGRNILQQIKDVNSGGNEAMGPMQIIPGTFQANMVPGYGDRNNPVHSIAAALNYIKRRYRGDFRGVATRGGGY